MTIPKWFDQKSGNLGNLVSVFIIICGVWCIDNPKHNASMLIDSMVLGSNPIEFFQLSFVTQYCDETSGNLWLLVYFVDKHWVRESSSLSLIQSCLYCLEGSQGTNQKMNKYKWKIWNKNILFWSYLGKTFLEVLRPPPLL